MAKEQEEIETLKRNSKNGNDLLDDWHNNNNLYYYSFFFFFFFSLIIILVNEREISPSKTLALVGIGLGLYDNIIIHSVNNILILLSMINSVNVKKIDT